MFAEITSDVIVRLLYEDESTTLDFKQGQYAFSGATDEQKSELLKDILAFTNAWRRADAFILIGIEEVRGGTHRIVGVQQHLVDHELQQFVNGKTHRAIEFHYRAVPFQNVSLGVIHIPVQSRPASLRQDYGKLRRNVVYIRRGSSTSEAAPEEVAQMGNTQGAEAPKISISFFNKDDNRLIGSELILEVTDLALPPAEEIPEYSSATPTEFGGFQMHFRRPTDNTEFYQEYAAYLREVMGVAPVNIAAINESGVLADDVRIEFSVEQIEGLRIVESLPSAPTPNRLLTDFNFKHRPLLHGPDFSVHTKSKTFDVVGSFGKIQPKGKVSVAAALYIGAKTTSAVLITGRIFADNLPDPIDFNLSIKINVAHRELTVDELVGGGDESS